jgi:hypothetical protein
MPKLGVMAQLSRPFQIALLALGVFVLAWFAVLHRPGGSSTSSSSPSVSSSAGSASKGSAAAGPASNGSAATGSSSVYHGSAPGLEGLTRDVQRAHGAAAQVESNGREVQSKAAQAPGEAASGGTPAAASHATASAHTGATANATASTAAGSRAQTHTSVRTASTSASETRPGAAQRTPHARSGSAAAAPSHSKSTTADAVAAELKHGKTVLLLFWNPHSFDDEAVVLETAIAAHRLGHSVAVHYARPKQVNSFGSITRNIQVYQTPTLLIINPKLQVTTLTGLTDSYSIEQAVAEARK